VRTAGIRQNIGLRHGVCFQRCSIILHNEHARSPTLWRVVFCKKLKSRCLVAEEIGSANHRKLQEIVLLRRCGPRRPRGCRAGHSAIAFPRTRRHRTSPRALRTLGNEAALADYEQAMFSRSETAAADAHRALGLFHNECAPFGLIDFFIDALEREHDRSNSELRGDSGASVP
jgi:hypothetical protein